MTGAQSALLLLICRGGRRRSTPHEVLERQFGTAGERRIEFGFAQRLTQCPNEAATPRQFNRRQRPVRPFTDPISSTE